MHGSAIKAAARIINNQQADTEYDAMVALLMAENARWKQLHGEEVEDRKRREAAHAALKLKWEVDREAMLAEYEAARAAARVTHNANVERLKGEWQKQKEEVSGPDWTPG